MVWLGTAERAVLARHSMSRDVEGAMWALYCALKDTAAILSSDSRDEKRVLASLNRIVRMTPFSAERTLRRRPRRKRPPSHRSLRP